METLTDRQRKVARTLIDWAREHKDGDAAGMCMDEGALAKAVDDGPWHRGYLEDLKALCNYCDRMEFPMVPLLVVIPGFGKPERRIMTEAFKTTLSTADAEARWSKELAKIKKTKAATWKAFSEAVADPEPEKPKRKAPAKKAAKAEDEKAEKAPKKAE